MKKIFLFVLLAGCAAAPAKQNATTPIGDALPKGMADTCGAVNYHTLLQQDGTALEKVLILGQVRIVRPDSILTQDYRPERKNFHIGTSGRIEKISCG